MGIFIPHKFLIVRIRTHHLALILSLFLCQNIWAAQSAIVMSERAVIYADEQMSAPVGFVRKGKKLKIGENTRNKSQVYPIMVSGKIAYIRVVDVNTEKESVDSTVLAAERFQKNTEDEQKTNYSVSYFNFSSQVSMDKENGGIKDKDSLNWSGVSFRGGAQMSPKWDLDLIFNVMEGKGDIEVFRAVEFGAGGALRIFEKSRFKVKLLGQLLGIPFASYAVKNDIRVNGLGFTTGGGVSLTYKMGKHFGVEGFGGLYYTKLTGFRAASPYQEVTPSFVGNRLGIGLNYQF